MAKAATTASVFSVAPVVVKPAAVKSKAHAKPAWRGRVR
jgi:hypothetical protein